MSRYLVNTPAAEQFLQMASIESGARALLGDAEKVDSYAASEILNANTALRNAVATISALVNDETRTLPQRHEAAATLADRVTAQLSKTKSAIETRAASLYASGLEDADNFFAPNLNRSHLDAQIIGYIKEQAAKPDGILKIGELAKTNKNVAAVIYQAEGFLLGIAEPTHSKMRFDAIENWLPKSYAKMTASIALQDLAPKYDRAISNVRTSFYSPAERAKMGSRVEV